MRSLLILYEGCSIYYLYHFSFSERSCIFHIRIYNLGTQSPSTTVYVYYSQMRECGKLLYEIYIYVMCTGYGIIYFHLLNSMKASIIISTSFCISSETYVFSSSLRYMLCYILLYNILTLRFWCVNFLFSFTLSRLGQFHCSFTEKKKLVSSILLALLKVVIIINVFIVH